MRLKTRARGRSGVEHHPISRLQILPKRLRCHSSDRKLSNNLGISSIQPVRNMRGVVIEDGEVARGVIRSGVQRIVGARVRSLTTRSGELHRSPQGELVATHFGGVEPCKIFLMDVQFYQQI